MANNRTGLAVMRIQPLHAGHCRILSKMAMACDTAILGLGSAQKSREPHDPWTVDERMKMVKNVFGDRLKIVPIVDLGASAPEEWVNYLIEKITKLGLKEPTDYFTGSRFDAAWYRDHFAADWEALEIADRNMDMNAFGRYIGVDGRIRRLHIIDRNGGNVPPATDIRTSLTLRNGDWMDWVPAVNYDIVENNFPEEFKVPDIDQ